MVSIQLNDVFDELRAQKERLSRELVTANHVIHVLQEFKFLLDAMRAKLVLDSKLVTQFSRLDERYALLVTQLEKEKSVTRVRERRARRQYSLACDWVGCHFSTNRKSRLAAHKNYHTGERPFQCQTCLKSFVGREALSTHSKGHLKVERCHLKTTNRRAVVKVLANEKPYACQQCQYRSGTRQALREHKWTHGERTHVCATCEKGFKSEKQLRNHSLTHSHEKRFKCKCGVAFRTSKTLRIHEKDKHSLETKKFPCSWPGCDFGAHYNWITERHFLVHTGEKPFACSQCPQRFRRKHYLKTHSLVHSGEKPFLCSWPGCERAFRSQQSKRSHELTHEK